MKVGDVISFHWRKNAIVTGTIAYMNEFVIHVLLGNGNIIVLLPKELKLVDKE